MIPLFVGISGLSITVALHAVATTLSLSLVKRYGLPHHQRVGAAARPIILSVMAAFLAVKHYLDIILWAVGYWFFAGLAEFANFDDAVYFSSVTYTTLGYGDIVLTNKWRLVCGIEAMNGILLFGWSTALLFLLVQYLWFGQDGASP
jgi:hypothetical protein